ncbi:MAG: hypothetical protein JJ992_15095, partial [Planctomycetes bacterium]|nr:hypothetical protein [Planctomycetota bacterium]
MDAAPRIQCLAEADDVRLCGGKAVCLGRMQRAGLPVPEGFVVTTAAFSTDSADNGLPSPIRPDCAEAAETLGAEVIAAYRAMGSPVVAVRSSATAEDRPGVSMAGQYETILGVAGEAALLDAIHRCRRSLYRAGIRPYLDQHGIDADSIAMAVIVQRLIPADVAGVLFTANPRTGDREEMLIEASWGLGEAVVSGLVQPDQIVVDGPTGQSKSYRIAEKRQRIAPASNQVEPNADDQRRIRCLPEAKIAQLWDLSRRAKQLFGSEQDLEWAIVGDHVYLLQSRPITAWERTDTLRVLLETERERLRDQASQGRGPWVRHNLAETLPHPTPLTWSLLRPFLSGEGGFGQLHRRVGFEPSEVVCRDGFLHLIAGRVYSDLSRAPEMYFADFPFRYDADLLRCSPVAAQRAPTLPAGSWLRRIRVSVRLTAVQQNLDELAVDLDRRLREEIVPEIETWVVQEKQRDLAALSAEAWCATWQERQSRVLGPWAVDLLLPGMIAAMAVERLRALLQSHCWEQDPDALLNELVIGRDIDRTIRMNQRLRGVGNGTVTLESWLAEHGHRGPDEFELAAPRWRERPAEVEELARRIADGPDPASAHQRAVAHADRRAEQIATGLPRGVRQEFDAYLSLVRRYLPWREDGKAILILGYDLLRDLALEAGRRLTIGERVFLLTFDELRTALTATGNVPSALLQERLRQ